MVKPAAGGIGLTGIIVAGGLLYYTGYGAVIVDKIQRLDQHCRSSFAGLGSASGPLCSGVSSAVEGITTVAETSGKMIRSVEDGVKGFFGVSGGDFKGVQAFGGSFNGAVNGLASSSDRLGQMILRGPQAYKASDASQQFQHAIDSFSIGQHYVAQGGAARAMPWLMQGARQTDGYGVLSQLSLGDLYRHGGSGIPADPVQSQLYYQQAINSLTMLNQNDSPQAKALLNTLPASPQVIQQQLLQAIAQLKAQQTKR